MPSTELLQQHNLTDISLEKQTDKTHFCEQQRAAALLVKNPSKAPEMYPGSGGTKRKSRSSLIVVVVLRLISI